MSAAHCPCTVVVLLVCLVQRFVKKKQSFHFIIYDLRYFVKTLQGM